MKLPVFKSIRSRLTLYFTSIFGVMLIIFSIVLYLIFAKQSRDDFDKILGIISASLEETVKTEGVHQSILSEMRDISIPLSSLSSQFVEIIDASGKIILKSDQLDDEVIPVSAGAISGALAGRQIWSTYETGNDKNLWDKYGVRIITTPVIHKNKKYIIVVASSLSVVESQLSFLRIIFLISIPAAVLLSAFSGWFFSKKAYKPVNELISKSNSISAEKLNERLPVNDSGDEIAHLSETLNNMIERLEKAFDSQKQFTSDASHELKTPLTILRGEIEVSLQKTRDTPEYISILKDSLEEVMRLQNIVESLLLLSRYENNSMEIDEEKIGLHELLIEAVSKMKNLAAKKHIRIILKLDENELYIQGDFRKLLNVIINLIDNSVKYSFKNSEVICALYRKDSNAVISIKDNGIGIPEADINKVFERFFRVNAARTRKDAFSLGLGLSISKVVVEAHRGSIQVKSEPGKGSEFDVSLPLIKD